jgi:hypothetical protein
VKNKDQRWFIYVETFPQTCRRFKRRSKNLMGMIIYCLLRTSRFCVYNGNAVTLEAALFDSNVISVTVQEATRL